MCCLSCEIFRSSILECVSNFLSKIKNMINLQSKLIFCFFFEIEEV